jgi:hypothetical protein
MNGKHGITKNFHFSGGIGKWFSRTCPVLVVAIFSFLYLQLHNIIDTVLFMSIKADLLPCDNCLYQPLGLDGRNAMFISEFQNLRITSSICDKDLSFWWN